MLLILLLCSVSLESSSESFKSSTDSLESSSNI